MYTRDYHKTLDYHRTPFAAPTNDRPWNYSGTSAIMDTIGTT